MGSARRPAVYGRARITEGGAPSCFIGCSRAGRVRTGSSGARTGFGRRLRELRTGCTDGPRHAVLDTAAAASYKRPPSHCCTEGRVISQRRHAIDVGDPAPGFTLRHTFHHDISLQKTLERGPVLLIFYVFDFGGL